MAELAAMEGSPPRCVPGCWCRALQHAGLDPKPTVYPVEQVMMQDGTRASQPSAPGSPVEQQLAAVCSTARGYSH